MSWLGTVWEGGKARWLSSPANHPGEREDVAGEGRGLIYQPWILVPTEPSGPSLVHQEGLGEPASLGREAG